MAVTSIWPVKGRVDKVVNYARNPEKTTARGLPDLAAMHMVDEDYAQMREVSDRLCKEYGLSVVKQPEGKSKSYGEWQAEKKGRFTHRGSIRADIDRAIAASTTERDFIRVMCEMGYEFKTRAKDGQPLKHPALKPPGAKGYFRFHKLGEGYSLVEVKNRILQNICKGSLSL